MLIDSHCHLDATEFDVDRALVVAAALKQGVKKIVVPTVSRQNFDAVIALRQAYPACAYALGIHPMYVDDADLTDIQTLNDYVMTHEPIAIGEIGLDYFVTKENTEENRERQVYFFTAQLKIANAHRLPVILHVRQAIDDVLKYCRRHHVHGGIAHAFNGSLQQAKQFLELGFKLGFGGAMTYTRALKIRQLALDLPLDAIVLETDAPDIPPAWCEKNGRNSPAELPKIAEVLANIKGLSIAKIEAVTSENTQKVLPKLLDLFT